MIKHFKVSVSEDDMKKENFLDGDIYDFAALAVTDFMKLYNFEDWRVVNIESKSVVCEHRPSLCNSSTWYDCEYVTLHVWITKDFGNDSVEKS